MNAAATATCTLILVCFPPLTYTYPFESTGLSTRPGMNRFPLGHRLDGTYLSTDRTRPVLLTS